MADQLSPGSLDRLLAGWTAASGPLYRRLAAALRLAIQEGRLAGGAVLPPERRLADELNVSRSTVVAALEELKDEGLLAAQQGSGTWVRRRRYASDGRRELVEDLEDHAIVRNLDGPTGGGISLTTATVDCAPEVRRAHLDLDEPTLERWTRGHGYLPLGVQLLREAVAERLTGRGLPTRPDQVLVTTG
ncbi:MAG: GntR family transcriptional regulator, partial [Nitriliruptorales bacterium]